MENEIDMSGPCHRCNRETNVTTMSWFTEEVICMDCKKEEKNLRSKLPESGRSYEGCGYIPWEFVEVRVK